MHGAMYALIHRVTSVGSDVAKMKDIHHSGQAWRLSHVLDANTELPQMAAFFMARQRIAPKVKAQTFTARSLRE
jgi:hypothetical protein